MLWKKLFPKPALCYQEEIAEFRGNCFSVFQKSSRDDCSRSATALDTRGAYRCDVWFRRALQHTRHTAHKHSKHRAHTKQTHTHRFTDPHRANTNTDTHTETHRTASQSPGFTKHRHTHTHISRVLPKSGQGTGDFLFCVSRLGCRALLCTPTKPLVFLFFLFVSGWPLNSLLF